MENKVWDFGTAQAKIKVENGLLTWKSFGGEGGSLPLRSVTAVSYESKGFFSVMAKVSILASGSDGKKIEVPKSSKSEKLIKEINDYIAESNSSKQPIDNSKSSIADEILKLANLKNQGVLTEEEFQQQKQKLLNIG